MMRTFAYAVLAGLLLALTGAGQESRPSGDAVRKALAATAARYAKSDLAAAKGQDGFYFLVSEVRHYGAGVFWGDDAPKVAVAPRNQDPLAAILDFQGQLKKAGVALVLVPVPGKTALYADKLDPNLPAGIGMDDAHQAFYELLRKEGVEVIDLAPAMLKMRKDGADTHCRQDSHWSPAAMKLAARTIAESVRKQPWCKDLPRKEAKLSERTVECAGDLAGMLEEKDAPKEKLTVEQVSLDGRAVGDDRDSPVVLMGDSHTVVYHEPISGGISAERAGLPDHLGAALGFAVDMTGSLGGGANVSRIYLAQRKDNLAGKKCLVWCFAVREFTESGQGWMKVPVVR